MTIAIIIYAALAAVTFAAYHREPISIRLKLAVIGPVVLVGIGIAWVVSRLEELG